MSQAEAPVAVVARMNPGTIAAFLIAATSTVGSGAVHAAPPACLGKRFVEARSISALPAGVAQLLGRDRPGLEGIADRGGDFNPTDIPDQTLPMRRFVLAAVSENCVLVALEQGGIAHYFSMLALERVDSTWRTTELGVATTPPHTLEELLAYVAK